MLSSALTIALIPNASGQQYTTSTSIVTSSLTQMITYSSESYQTVASTETGTITTIVAFTISLSPVVGTICYPSDFVFVNTTGTTQIEYSVNEPMTLYVLNWPSAAQWVSSINAFTFLGGGECTIPASLVTYQERILALSGSYPVSGSFNLNLPSTGNPYLIYLAGEKPNPTATLTVSPALTAQTTTATISIPMTLTTTGNTTLTYYNTLEVPFMQTYGNLTAAIIILAVVILVGVWAISGLRRRTSHQS
ncbi:MAG: hypothetical protein ACLPY5_08595 [Candidatus Bathyarchaeia archaeon]